jgi:hypothetical protein
MHGVGCEVFVGVSDTPSCSAPWVDSIIDDSQAGDVIPPFLNLPRPMLGVQPLIAVAPNPSMFDILLRHKGFRATAKPHSFKPPRPTQNDPGQSAMGLGQLNEDLRQPHFMSQKASIVHEEDSVLETPIQVVRGFGVLNEKVSCLTFATQDLDSEIQVPPSPNI